MAGGALVHRDRADEAAGGGASPRDEVGRGVAARLPGARGSSRSVDPGAPAQRRAGVGLPVDHRAPRRLLARQPRHPRPQASRTTPRRVRALHDRRGRGEGRLDAPRPRSPPPRARSHRRRGLPRGAARRRHPDRRARSDAVQHPWQRVRRRAGLRSRGGRRRSRDERCRFDRRRWSRRWRECCRWRTHRDGRSRRCRICGARRRRSRCRGDDRPGSRRCRSCGLASERRRC
ncbi:hypothetical protein RS85_00089 [Microbacterium sp. SA39]|nr:hypothetical protein RS85_00089 [Microbacterium sp. SA39]